MATYDFEQDVALEYQLEAQQEAESAHKAAMWDEFEQSYTDFEIAKLFVENGDEEMTLEEFKEILFDEYMENRD